MFTGSYWNRYIFFFLYIVCWLFCNIKVSAASPHYFVSQVYLVSYRPIINLGCKNRRERR